MAAWFVWMLFIGAFPVFISDSSMYQVPMHVFANPNFWLVVVVVSMLCTVSSLAKKYYLRTYLLYSILIVFRFNWLCFNWVYLVSLLLLLF